MAPSFDIHHGGRKEIVGALLVLLLFVIALFSAEYFEDVFKTIPHMEGYWGMLAYTLLAIFATVIAPFSTVPLLPIASSLWGPLVTALLSILGWTLGAIVAFLIARKFGHPIVTRFVSLERAENITQSLAGEKPFWSIVIVRMLVPVDILSYAIGLLLPVPLRTYTAATVIGVAPFAFIFSYTSVLPFYAQISVITGALFVLLVGYRRYKYTKG